MQIKPTERTSKPSSEMDFEENQNKHPEDSYQIDKQADLPQNLTPVQKQYEANPQQKAMELEEEVTKKSPKSVNSQFNDNKYMIEQNIF